jgi:GDP-mannose 6-dehydrogenase
MTSISVFGLGYVGSVTATCLAHLGHSVVGLDINPAKVEMLNSGRSPIVEAGMDELARQGHQSGRLTATTDAESAIRCSELSFICVATPSQNNGKLDLSSIERVCQHIGRVLRDKAESHTVVVRSTVLPGTTESLIIPVLESASGKREGNGFGVCVSPEFMREGTAVQDFFTPPFAVLGAADPQRLAGLRQLYAFASAPLFEVALNVAEMVKYVCNAFHAVKVCFANEVGTLCQQLSLSPAAVMQVFTADTILNISPAYLMPGFAFGGSCLPKDIRALNYRARELDLHLPLLQSVLPSNAEHVERAVQAVLHTGKRKIGMLGLSFKAGTDDLRESPSVQLIKRLLGEGHQISVWDENVSMGRLLGSNRQFIQEVIPHIGSFLCDNMTEVIASAEVVVLGTRGVDPQAISARLRPDQILINLVSLEYSTSIGAAGATSGR